MKSLIFALILFSGMAAYGTADHFSCNDGTELTISSGFTEINGTLHRAVAAPTGADDAYTIQIEGLGPDEWPVCMLASPVSEYSSGAAQCKADGAVCRLHADCCSKICTGVPGLFLGRCRAYVP